MTGTGRHIEIFGIGGAGKTTLFGRAEEIYEGTALAFEKPAKPSGAAVVAAICRLVAMSLWRAPRVTAALLQTAGGRWLFAKLGYRRAALAGRRSEGRTMVLVDCGLYEPLISHAMFYGAADSGFYESLLAMLPRPCAGVHLQADTELAYGRFVDRESRLGRIDLYGDREKLRQHFDTAARLCGFLHQWCERNGISVLDQPPVMLYDDTSVRSLLQKLETY